MKRFAALCALSLIATSLPAFVLLQPERTWDNPPTYIVDNRGQAGIADPDGGITATINAIVSNSAWNGSGSGTLVNAVSGSVGNFQLGDGVPMLNFTDPINACNGTCLAATFTGFFSPRGDGTTRIDDADIVTNVAQPWSSLAEASCSNEFYIEGVMVHEIGHALGLGHTPVSGATMFASVGSCNNGPATTESDDDAGVNELYGNTGGGDSCVGNCGQQAPGGCWCDDQCVNFGDCCADKAAACDAPPDPNSCVGNCGQQAPGGCWCDTQCSQFGDCCGDKFSICG